MVRKRSRTARKHYDDDNDSDSDFALDEHRTEPAQKTYSLRQRKRRLFTEFEFDDDGDEIPPTKVPSDDDDFQVEKELELEAAAGTEYDSTTYINDIPEDASDALIDFEDMIRADIVVNENRIDYDNVIQKTEIKVHPVVGLLQSAQPVVKSRRGRKPKARPENEIDSSILEPETEVHEAEFDDKKDKDYNPDEDIDNDDPIDCAQLMQAELSESAHELPCTDEINPPISPVLPDNETKPPEQVPDNDSMEKVSESSVPYINPEIVDVIDKAVVEEAVAAVMKKEVVEVDDDDVVLVEDEKKCEVIVLDD